MKQMITVGISFELISTHQDLKALSSYNLLNENRSTTVLNLILFGYLTFEM